MITAIAPHHKLIGKLNPSKTTPEPVPTPISYVKPEPTPNDTFGRILHEDEIKGIIAGDHNCFVKTCELIHQNVINVKDGALKQVYDLSGRYRSYVQWDAIRKLLEKKRDTDVKLP